MSTLPWRIRCTLTPDAMGDPVAGTPPIYGAALVPTYAREGDSGIDLRAVSWRRSHDGRGVRRVGGIDLDPGERVQVHSGLAIELPEGLEAQVRPRSGLALDHGVGVVFVGTIDSNYRGELGVVLVNLGDTRVTLERGERVAQMVIAPVVRAQLELVDALTPSVRGEAGYGSSGRR